MKATIFIGALRHWYKYMKYVVLRRRCATFKYEHINRRCHSKVHLHQKASTYTEATPRIYKVYVNGMVSSGNLLLIKLFIYSPHIPTNLYVIYDRNYTRNKENPGNIHRGTPTQTNTNTWSMWTVPETRHIHWWTYKRKMLRGRCSCTKLLCRHLHVGLGHKAAASFKLY